MGSGKKTIIIYGFKDDSYFDKTFQGYYWTKAIKTGLINQYSVKLVLQWYLKTLQQRRYLRQ